MNILLTGATGKVGSRLTPAFIEAGHTVRALVRDPSSEQSQMLAATGAEVIRGDILESDTLAAALTDIDSVAHLAEMSTLFERWKWHPAQRLHLVHHADIAQGINLLLHAARHGGEIYNLADDAPTTAYDILRITHQTAQLADPASPLEKPWDGIVSTDKIRALGFRPLVPTLYAAHYLHLL